MAMLRAFALIVSLLLGACATVPPEQPARAPESPMERACAQFHAQLERAVAEAGVGDAQDARVPGFPYLRTNRFLASLRQGLDSPAAFAAWVDRLQALGDAGTAVELANLPPAERQQLLPLAADGDIRETARRCGEALRARDLALAGGRDALPWRAEVPPEYVPWQRVAGLYPLTALAFAAGIRNWHRETREMFARPLADLPRRGELVRFAPPEPGEAPDSRQVAEILARAARNPLHIPEPDEADRERLFAAFAPHFEVDVAGPDDLIGAPVWRNALPEVDTAVPTVYRHISHARVAGKALLQLNYIAWFPARAMTSSLDLLGGRFDGITWRVTLAPDGRPWVFDSMHNCGCYHLFFPTPRARPLPPPDSIDESAFVPQPAPDWEPGRGPVLRVESRTHYLQRILSAATGEGRAARYRWADYDDLRSLPAPDGARRSLFRPDGMVPGTERGERFLFWPMGIPNPGGMRQWGHHATAFVGWRHFDDADLLEKAFAAAP